MKTNTIIVSLTRAIDRTKIMHDQIKKLKLKNIFFYSCFDGNNLTNDTYSIKINMKNGYCYRRGEDLSPRDIGCSISHLGALSMAKAMNWEHVVIIEDDVILAEDYEKRLDYLFKILPKDWEHVYLSGDPHFDASTTDIQKKMYKDFIQVIPTVYTNCTFAYMVKNTAYDKLIKKLTALEATTDDIMNNFIFTDKKLISYTYFPFVAMGNPDLTSNIYPGLKPMDNHPSVVYFKNKML